MSKTQLFEPWTFGLDFNPVSQQKYAQFVANNGGKVSSSRESLSKYNQQKSGKRATLHAPLVEAVDKLASFMFENDKSGATGKQRDASGKVLYYCGEFTGKTGEAEFGVYNPINGTFKIGVVDSGGALKGTKPLGQKGYYGGMCYFLLAYASLDDGEFKARFEKYYNDPDVLKRDDIEDMFCMCDNVYRRVETPSPGTAALAVNIPSSNNIPKITQLKLDSGEYSPNSDITGDFIYLKNSNRSNRAGKRTMEELTCRYSLNLLGELEEEEKSMIPVMDATYQPTTYLVDMAMMVKEAGMRKYMLRSESGLGKTTDARALAAVLGLPYRVFTCSENTDEMEVLANMIPNTGKSKK